MILSLKKVKVQLLSIMIAAGVGTPAGFLSRNSMAAFRALAVPVLGPVRRVSQPDDRTAELNFLPACSLKTNIVSFYGKP